VLLLATRATLAAERPNFVIIIADDVSCEDCSPYGARHVRTPMLDKLAAEGMRFDRAVLTCSSCSPSRASILTGRYPHNTGAEQLHWPLPASQVTLPELLRGGGYWTVSCGKWHLGSAAHEKFDRVVEGDGKWVQVLRDRPRDKPFFAWLAAHDAHRPYKENAIREPHRPSEVVVPPYLADCEETRRDLALYYDEVSRLDGAVGDVLAELDRQGIAGETLVLFLADNGRPFPRCKTTLYDSGIRTPFLVRFPGHLPPGSVCTSLVSSIDIAPTLIELAGIGSAKTFQGTSFVPTLRDPKAQIDRYVFAEHNWHDYTACERAVRSTRYKYIRNDYPELPLTPPADAVTSISHQAMRKLRDAGKLSAAQSECFFRPRASEALYDLDADPHELVNLAAVPALADVVREMRDELTKWRKRTGDGPPRVRTPDEFDRETGQPLSNWQGYKGRQPAEGQRSEAP
jgi:arylsulfatase A-like enzyme